MTIDKDGLAKGRFVSPLIDKLEKHLQQIEAQATTRHEYEARMASIADKEGVLTVSIKVDTSEFNKSINELEKTLRKKCSERG